MKSERRKIKQRKIEIQTEFNSKTHKGKIMENQVLQAVIDYVTLPNTDYAILINGPWGCGKTYFWKNMVEPKLKDLLEYQQIERMMYVSLYGVSNVKDIDRAMFAQSYPGINHKLVGRVSRFISGAAEALGRIDLEKVDLRSLAKVSGVVICFDDLERCNLTFKDVLGYINTFVEHEGAKVIILCNEKAFEKEEELKLYKKMKEKVVGISLDYDSDYKSVLSTLMNEYKDQKEFYDFICNKAELIFHLFKCSKTDNLRVLRRAITSLNMVFKTINEKEIDPNELSEQIIYAVAPTAFELYGHGIDPKKLKEIHNENYIYLSQMMNLSPKKDEPEEKRYVHLFTERYLSTFDFWNWSNVVGCQPICEFMITGFLDKTSLLEWARELTKKPDEKEERIRCLTTNPREMNDEEFEATTSQALHDVEAGNIADIRTYLSLYRVFDWFAKDDLISESNDQITEKFKQGLIKAQQAGRLESNKLLELDKQILLKDSETNRYKDFCDHILDVNNSIVENQKRSYIMDLASHFQDNPDDFIKALTDSAETGFSSKPIFHELDAENTSKQILSLSNPSKMRLWGALHERYIRFQPQSQYVAELPTLIGIRDTIKYRCDKSVKISSVIPMSTWLEKDIVKILDQIIDLLEKLKTNGENK